MLLNTFTDLYIADITVVQVYNVAMLLGINYIVTILRTSYF